MTKLPGPIYIKKPNRSTEVLTFGKPEELYERDLKDGISRFGGFLRGPNYSQAYLKSAEIVLNKAMESCELDELGLPIFYFIRHAVELEIKSILEMAYEVLKTGMECCPETYSIGLLPSGRQLRRLSKSHDLDDLFRDLKSTCASLRLEVPEEYFMSVINLITTYESNPTWSRYSKSEFGSHVDVEVLLPISGLLSRTKELFAVLSFDQEGDASSLVMDLYHMINFHISESDRMK